MARSAALARALPPGAGRTALDALSAGMFSRRVLGPLLGVAATALDDAARYLRALWPQGTRMMFDAESAGCAWLRWEPKQGPVMSGSVPIVEGEAPSATLARLVARLREMAVAERDAAEARATTLCAAIGGES